MPPPSITLDSRMSNFCPILPCKPRWRSRTPVCTRRSVASPRRCSARFFPNCRPAIGSFEIGRIYAPGSEVAVVGGDTYDLFTLPDGRIAAVIGDISGKGISAATLAVMAKYTVRAYALDNPDPASILSRVNEALIPQTGDATFLTMIVAVIDPISRRKGKIACAAHPPALVWRASRRVVETLDVETGLIAGFLHGSSIPGDALRTRPRRCPCLLHRWRDRSAAQEGAVRDRGPT